MGVYDKTDMVVRFYIGLRNHEERFGILKEFLKRTGIHRVSLFSASFPGMSSIMSEDYYKEHAKMLEPYVEELRADGVEIGVNMLYTIGHCFYADESEFGFKRAVTLSGHQSRGCVCPRQESVKEYVGRIYGYYARLNPSWMFCDDDVRGISMGEMICLCDEHLKAISERVGKTVTLEDVQRAVYSDGFETDPVKEAFLDQLSEDLENIILAAADGVHKISPQTQMGIMLTSYPDVTVDRNLKEFFRRNYGKINGVRPGMCFYKEGEPKEMPMMFSMPAIERELIDDDRVEYQPEIENDTYGFFWKSNSVTNMQIVWALANGFKNMQVNMFNPLDPQVDNFDEIASLFAENSKYYNKLAELIPLNKRSSGVRIFTHEKSLYAKRCKTGQFFFFPDWHRYLLCDGVPVGYDKCGDYPVMLTGDDLLCASDEEIDSLLKKGAVIDLSAAEALVFRGFGERIGVLGFEKITKPFAGEVFCNVEINGKYQGYDNSDYFDTSLTDERTVSAIKYKEGATPVSEVVDHHRNRICNCVTAYENENGERFCIIPKDANFFSQFSNINNKRKTQLINAFEWIARKELPVYACNELVSVNINEFENYNVIGLFNLTSDDVQTPSIAYRPKHGLYYLAQNGTLRALKYGKDGRIIRIEKTLKAKGALIIVDKSKEGKL